MSAPATWAEGAAFLKRYPSAAAAGRARQRTRAARSDGVPTPEVLAAEGPLVLSFARVLRDGTPTLADLLEVASQLHRSRNEGLTRFDPFLRIRTRIAGAPPALGAVLASLQRRDAGLRWPETGPIHGDLHPGQALRDAAGKVWLVDLDDMALAPPEADLGNVAAWLATQEPGDLGTLADRALIRVLSLSPQADPALSAHFCAIALLRRALKLFEAGQAWAVESYPCGRAMSYFSIR